MVYCLGTELDGMLSSLSSEEETEETRIRGIMHRMKKEGDEVVGRGQASSSADAPLESSERFKKLEAQVRAPQIWKLMR